MLRVSGSIQKLARPQVTKCRRLATEATKPEAKAAETAKPVPPSQQPPPPPPEPRGGGGVFGKLLALTLLGTGGTVGYAWYDPKFRKQLEDNVPYAKEGFENVFRYLPDGNANTGQKPLTSTASGGPIVSDKEAQAVKEQGLVKLPKKSVEEKPKAEKLSKKELEKQRLEAEKLEAKEAKKREEEKARLALLDKQAEEAAENAALEAILQESREDGQERVKAAIAAQKNACALTKLHSEALKKAMDLPEEVTGKEDQWADVTKANDERVEATSAAERAADEARMIVERLKHAIEEGKSSKVTKKNKALRKAEEELNSLSYDLNNAVAELSKAESEARVMKEYRDLVKKGKEQFKKELESLMPDVKIGNRFGGKMTEDELNSLIAHAHRRIEQLQRQLLEQQKLEQLRIQAALDRQKEEDEKIARDKVKREKHKMKKDFEIEKMKWDAQAEVQFEEDLRQHLARQAAAHSDHLADVLRVRERELDVEFKAKLGEKILEERDRFQTEVAGWIARMKGIESAVEARADLEKQARKAQELWLACQALYSVLVTGKPDAYSWEDQLKPLASELQAIKQAGDDHPFVNTIIEAVPDAAVKTGVWTEEGLFDRFNKVNRICRRVAMIDETGGTLMRYFVSYIQSFFVVSSKPIVATPGLTEIDLDSLNTFKILDNARYCVEKGDLEQALRFMNQLQGESRRAARDWIQDTRLFLETRQAANALLAHASSQGLGALQ